MPQESTPCLPPCQCRKPKRTSAEKGTQANGEEALLYPAERFCGWGKTGSENGFKKIPSRAVAGTRQDEGARYPASGSASGPYKKEFPFH